MTVSRDSFTGRSVTLWDIGKRTLLRRLDQISEVVVTPDARTAALFTEKRSNRVDVQIVNLEVLVRTGIMSGDGSTITARAITPDGRYAVSVARWGSAIKAWNLKTGQEQSSFVTSRVDHWFPVERGRLLSQGRTDFGPNPILPSWKPPPTRWTYGTSPRGSAFSTSPARAACSPAK